ncbi:MAG: YceI family protein [Acidobacteriota bacterium]
MEMKKNWILTVLSCVLVSAAGASLEAAVYQVDPTHSVVGFSVRHLMITNVRGEFTDYSATVNWDPQDPSSFSVEAVIKVSSINTRNERRDNHLRSADFFDAENHPEMKFTSRRVSRSGEGKLQVTGDLTIRGVTRQVTLDVEGPTPAIKDPWGNERIGAVATTTINRTDFGLNWNQALEAGGVVVGEEVTINLELELVKQK